MSFELDIARDSFIDLKQLELWFQEEMLDELEEMADDPPPTPPAVRVHRMIRIRDDKVHYAFLRIHIDPVQGKLTLLGITTPPNQ